MVSTWEVQEVNETHGWKEKGSECGDIAKLIAFFGVCSKWNIMQKSEWKNIYQIFSWSFVSLKDSSMELQRTLTRVLCKKIQNDLLTLSVIFGTSGFWYTDPIEKKIKLKKIKRFKIKKDLNAKIRTKEILPDIL